MEECLCNVARTRSCHSAVKTAGSTAPAGHASVKISEMPDYLRVSWAVGYAYADSDRQNENPG